jgi:Ca-activated chloride channel family protein
MTAPDDPRLTAYALDAVDPDTEAVVEEALRGSEAARDAVTETEQAAHLVAEAWSGEPALVLRPEQREAVLAAARQPLRRRTWRPVALAALAAALAVALGLLVFLPDLAPDPGKVAEVAPPPSAPPTPVVPPGPAPERRVAPSSPAPVRRRTEAAPPPSPAPVTVRGIVRDASGGVLPGTEITVRAVDTGHDARALADGQGSFRLTAVPAGPLEVHASLQGFKTLQLQVDAEAGSVVVWEPTLQVGEVAETVMVAAETAPVSTASGALAVYRRRGGHGNTEDYRHRDDTPFVDVRSYPLSTFSVDVDTASYSNLRRFLRDDALPPPDAVRIEELVNYFPYARAEPRDGARFAAQIEMAPAPWAPRHRLLRIGLNTASVSAADRPPANLVFLVDVSGSMDEPNKLPLVKQALRLLAESADARDRLAIVVYAGAAGEVLAPTRGDDKAAIRAAIDDLEAGGSTNGGEGIALAYDLARRGFIEGGVNRVVLATDGDFNVGTTDEGSLVRLVREKAAGGVFLTVLGFGMGNLKDGLLETLADRGDGSYAYIDTLEEAKKALVEQASATLVTVAKDVKLQVEFNPVQVESYRLIGYENRMLAPEDFADDRKDAGEVGAGHTVTALYEVIPARRPGWGPRLDPLRYQGAPLLTDAAHSDEVLRLRLRYKEPEGGKIREQDWTLSEVWPTLEAASPDFRFAASVAAFGMLLRDAKDTGDATFEMVLRLAEAARGADPGGYRAEFIELVRIARTLREAQGKDAASEDR